MTGILSRLFPDSPRPLRFVLLAHPRSGSNLVAYSLEAHRQLAMLSEVLSQWPHVRAKCAKGPRHSASYPDGMDGAKFLDEKVFLHKAPRGVKLFYDHARFTPAAKTAWEYILNDQEIRIIHLRRENLLANKLSLDIALKTDQWFLENKDAAKQKIIPPFAVDPLDYEFFFHQVRSAQAWVAEAFTHHPVLELEYDRDLCADFPAAMARVFEFLGLAAESPEKRLSKQARVSPAEQIANFDELREHFRYTVFESHFANGGAQ